MTEPKHKEKYTLEEVKEFPPKFLARLIRQGKQYLKTDPVMLEVFREYDVPIEEIDYIPTMFSDIDVSARTDHGVIYLNYKLLCDGDFFKDFSYLTHEGSTDNSMVILQYVVVNLGVNHGKFWPI